jgi:hypothetical protein
MSFVDFYLPYFRQQLIICPLWAFPPFQPLFTESSHGDQLLATLPFFGVLPTFSPPVLCASVQFIFYSVFFLCCVQSARGLCWFILGVAGGIPHDAWYSPVWYAKCLPSSFGTGVWHWQEPSCFLNVTWHGAAFYGLGVQGVEVLILLSVLYPPTVASASQKDF